MARFRLEFTGRNQAEIAQLGANEARSKFLYRFFTDLSKLIYPEKADFLDSADDAWMFIPRSNQLWMMFKEIIKNIHDHNGGWGYGEFEIGPDGVRFELGNSPNPEPANSEHQPDSKVNFGVGLGYSRSFNFMTLDEGPDYIYRGTFQLPL